MQEDRMDVMFRQGDVLVLRVEGDAGELGERVAEPRDDGRVVLAYGEVTGHAHAIVDEAATLWRLAGDDRLLLVGGDTAVALRHEEHATIMVPPGAYVVRRQREFAPDGEDEASAFDRTRYVCD
jgi:hypothetical protein